MCDRGVDGESLDATGWTRSLTNSCTEVPIRGQSEYDRVWGESSQRRWRYKAAFWVSSKPVGLVSLREEQTRHSHAEGRQPEDQGAYGQGHLRAAERAPRCSLQRDRPCWRPAHARPAPRTEKMPFSCLSHTVRGTGTAGHPGKLKHVLSSSVGDEGGMLLLERCVHMQDRMLQLCEGTWI